MTSRTRTSSESDRRKSTAPTFGRHTTSRRSVRLPSRMNQSELNDALLLCIAGGTYDEISQLLVAGADPNVKDSLGRPVLQTVLLERGGDPEIIKLLLTRGSSVDEVCCRTGQTSLHVAARKGFQVSLGYMLNQSTASINCLDSIDRTPLMLSCRFNHDATVKQLIHSGADQSIQNDKGETALYLAVTANSVTCARVLLEADRDLLLMAQEGQRPRTISPLLLAAKNNQMEMVELMLSFPCNVNDTDDVTQRTALHWASFHNSPSSVSRLLRLGADVRLRDADWATPFTLALGQGHREVLSLLITAGCDVTSTNRSFNTAMHIAASCGFSDVIALLFNAGLDVNLKGAGGMTPLMLSAWGGHLSVTRTLLNLGANVDVVDGNHACSLLYAVLAACTQLTEDSMSLEVVKLLVRRNSSLDVPANISKLCRAHGLSALSAYFENSKTQLRTPLELAFLTGNKSMFRVLLKAGCDVRLFNSSTGEYKRMRIGSGQTWTREISSAADHMIEVLRAHRQSVFTLTRLCRQPALAALFAKNPCIDLASLNLSKSVQSILEFRDLDELGAVDNFNKEFSTSKLNGKVKKVEVRNLRDEDKRDVSVTGTRKHVSSFVNAKQTSGSSRSNNEFINRSCRFADLKKQSTFPVYIPRDDVLNQSHQALPADVVSSVQFTNVSPSNMSSNLKSVSGSLFDIRKNVGIATRINDEQPRPLLTDVKTVHVNDEQPRPLLTVAKTFYVNDEQPRPFLTDVRTLCINDEQPRPVSTGLRTLHVSMTSRIPVFTRSKSIRLKNHKK